jgi:hypothetical protein
MWPCCCPAAAPRRFVYRNGYKGTCSKKGSVLLCFWTSQQQAQQQRQRAAGGARSSMAGAAGAAAAEEADAGVAGAEQAGGSPRRAPKQRFSLEIASEGLLQARISMDLQQPQSRSYPGSTSRAGPELPARLAQPAEEELPGAARALGESAAAAAAAPAAAARPAKQVAAAAGSNSGWAAAGGAAQAGQPAQQRQPASWGSTVVETLLVASLLMYCVGLLPKLLPGQQVGAASLQQQLLNLLLLLLLLLHFYVKPLDASGSHRSTSSGNLSQTGVLAATGAGLVVPDAPSKAGGPDEEGDGEERPWAVHAQPAVSIFSAAVAAAIAVVLSLPGIVQLTR